VVAHTDLNGSADQAELGGRKTLPKQVRINTNPSFSPNELRVLKAMTGRTLENLMGDECDSIQAMVWLALRDLGFTGVTWDECADVRGEMVPPDADPFTGSDSTTLPPSAGSGDALLATSTGSPPTSELPSSGT